MDREERERLLWQLAGKDNWEAIGDVDNWLVMFDFLPPKMRLTVDLKVQGKNPKEIAKIMNVAESTVIVQLWKAKRRFMSSLL